MPKGDNTNPEPGAAATRGRSQAEMRAEAAERREKVRKAVKAGVTIPEIAERLGIRQQRVASDLVWLYRHRKLQKGQVVPAPRGPRKREKLPRISKYGAKRAALLARVEGGEEYAEVALELGVPYSTAYYWVNNSGLFTGERRNTRGRNPEVEAKRRRFLTLVADNWPKTHAALEVGISSTTGTRWAREAGISESGGPRKERSPDPVPFEKLPDIAKRACDSPSVFCGTYLDLTLPPWAEITLEKLLELYHSPEDEYVNFNVHPGSGKSTILTYAFNAWAVARERALGGEPTISVGHDVWAKATWYVKRLRTLWTHNQRLINDFGRFRPESAMAPWSVEELLVEPLDWASVREKEPTISAASYDGGVLSGRFKIVEWDDLVSRRNSTTVDQREKLWEWWTNEAETRLEPGGLLVNSNARYGPEDLSHMVRADVDLDELGDGGEARPLYHQIAFKAHYDEKCNGREHTGPWPDGCLLNPSRASWRRLRHFMVRNEGRFRLVWQQEDTDPRGFLAQKVWFEGGIDSHGFVAPGCLDADRRFGQLPERTDRPDLSLLSIDPSSSHYWAIEHWLIYPDEDQVLLRGKRAVLKVPELLYPEKATGGYTGIFEDWWNSSLAVGVPYTYLIYEWNIQKALLEMPYFAEWAMGRGVTAIPHTTTINKSDPDTGLEMLGPLYQFGKVRLPTGGIDEEIFARAFIREACSWPEGSTDDLLMAHWFPNHRLRNLVASTYPVGERSEMPDWATRTSVPEWVTDRLGRGPVDRDRMVVGG